MATKADVVIIGGGIIGCSIAYYLAKNGVKPLLLEQKGICEGTSSACDGFVFMQTKKPGIQLEMAMASADLYSVLSAELHREVYYHRPGGLILIETPELLKVMEEIVAKQQSQGMAVEMISGDEARRMEPCLSPNVLAAACSDWDGLVSPIDATFAYADAAADLGATIMPHMPVTDIKLRNGAIAGVVTPAGEIETDCLIMACGVWSAALGELLGLQIPVKPRRGHTLITEPLAPMFNKVMLDSRYIAIKHFPQMAKDSDDEFMRLGVGLGIEQSHHGNVIIGNSRDFAGYDTSVSHEVLRSIAKYVSKFIPFLQDVNIIRTFAGLRPYCSDGSPILGPVKQIPGLIMATGHEGDGIALAPITGQLIMEYIRGQRTQFDLTPFLFERFSGEVRS